MREVDDDADLPVLARAPLGCMQLLIGTVSGLVFLGLSFAVCAWIANAISGGGAIANVLYVFLFAGSLVGGVAVARVVRRFQTKRLVRVDVLPAHLESGAGPSTPTATRALRGRDGREP